MDKTGDAADAFAEIKQMVGDFEKVRGRLTTLAKEAVKNLKDKETKFFEEQLKAIALIRECFGGVLTEEDETELRSLARRKDGGLHTASLRLRIVNVLEDNNYQTAEVVIQKQ